MHTFNRRKFLKAVSLAGLLVPAAGRAISLDTSNANFRNTSAFESHLDDNYLAAIKDGLKKEWPGNKTFNLVFHGHSVPAGYFKTPVVNTLNAYPHLLLVKLKALYPHAVINTINTAIGGENSQQGAKRMNEVFKHQPDIVFIDYALNDRGIDLEASRNSWSSMIKRILKKNSKVILLTPSPDLKEDILSEGSELKKHADQIRSLAGDFSVGMTDSYRSFREIASGGGDLSAYMSQFNHPNEKGHEIIAGELLKYFL